MFGSDEIKAIAQKSLNEDINIPDNHKGALVTVVNTDKVEIVSAIKINDHWTAEIVASHQWTGSNDIGFVNKVTW